MFDEIGNLYTQENNDVNNPTGSPLPQPPSRPLTSIPYTQASTPQFTVFDVEHGEATDETFSSLPPLSSPEFASALNLSYDVAQQRYNEAITEHMLITTGV